MTKFIINEGYGDVETVEGAVEWRTVNDFVLFFKDGTGSFDSVVFAMAKSKVTTIKRVAD